MTFTQNFFAGMRPDMEAVVPKTAKTVLEVGVFEGRSTLFFCEWCAELELLVAVDHFEGGDGLDGSGLFERFTENTLECSHKIQTLVGSSWQELPKLQANMFDVVCVDGSHATATVMHDAVQAYRVCRIGGVLVFDDYTWGHEAMNIPKIAIDAFEQTFVMLVEHIPTTPRVRAFRKVA